ncbi:MAG TPA: hypothetical protein VHB79_07930 [Polyangiaceae bacterium]|nr:hypothetical protein [Polyangiaceae bacterium]
MVAPCQLASFCSLSVALSAILIIACEGADQIAGMPTAAGSSGAGVNAASPGGGGLGGNIRQESPAPAGVGGAGAPPVEQGGASSVGGALMGGNAGANATGGVTGGAPALTTKDFQCTELIGLWVASQWWGSFEKGVEDASWQFMFQHHGYLELFADPESEFWKNQVTSPCSVQSQTPDRVVFLPFSLTLDTLEQWQTNLAQVVETMKGRFPGVKRIELMTTLRSPRNMPCANDTDPNTIVPAYVDEAIANVADASGGLVTVGPKIELKTCDWWAGGTDLTGAGNAGAGELLAQYYQTH